MKLLINGFYGKMGQIVYECAKNTQDVEIVGGIDLQEQNVDNIKVVSNPNNLTIKPDVIIDFSIPKATLNILEYAKENSIPIVIATTGFSDDELNLIKNYSKDIPIFMSSNMSFQINLIAKILKEITPLLNNSDIEIIETHHNRKIDAPSGTAILLADKINESLNNSYSYEFNRHDKREKRSKNEIGFSSIRGGNIVGEHSVMYFTDTETLEIKHTVHDRKIFAEGAIKAAKFIINKNNGMYNMENILK